jgi:hypothetical protein
VSGPGAGTAPQACPGTLAQTLRQKTGPVDPTAGEGRPLRLGNWPVEIALIQPLAPFLKNAHLLICADCAPFLVPDLHERFLDGRVVLVGCPKLDDAEAHLRKLTAVFEAAQPASITVLRTQVPCCGGLPFLVKKARDAAGLRIPVEVHTAAINDGSLTTETIAADA